MKRFMLFIAMVGFVATSCSKTIVKDEVETAISFSTESGKLTRAIVQNDKYFEAQPFGVFAYGSQDDHKPFMDNVEVSCTSSTWKATGTTKYYWPNDPETTINFYSYSPACSTANATSSLADHQVLNCTELEHTETDNGATLQMTGYTHSNMYVDFMVATPVKGATFGNPDGNAQADDTDGKVPMVFHHQMTQIIFTVKTNAAYSGVNFAVQSITLKDVTNVASYTQNYNTSYGTWESAETGDYQIFPAVETDFGGTDKDEYNHDFDIDRVNDGTIVSSTSTLETVPVTMIPQTIVASADAVKGQKFEIVYTINGTGVASEVVTKTLDLYVNTSSPQWIANRKITYNVVIGLKEITFEPSVAEWDATDETQNNKPYGDDFEFAQ